MATAGVLRVVRRSASSPRPGPPCARTAPPSPQARTMPPSLPRLYVASISARKATTPGLAHRVAGILGQVRGQRLGRGRQLHRPPAAHRAAWPTTRWRAGTAPPRQRPRPAAPPAVRPGRGRPCGDPTASTVRCRRAEGVDPRPASLPLVTRALAGADPPRRPPSSASAVTCARPVTRHSGHPCGLAPHWSHRPLLATP